MVPCRWVVPLPCTVVPVPHPYTAKHASPAMNMQSAGGDASGTCTYGRLGLPEGDPRGVKRTPGSGIPSVMVKTAITPTHGRFYLSVMAVSARYRLDIPRFTQ